VRVRDALVCARARLRGCVCVCVCVCAFVCACVRVLVCGCVRVHACVMGCPFRITNRRFRSKVRPRAGLHGARPFPLLRLHHYPRVSKYPGAGVPRPGVPRAGAPRTGVPHGGSTSGCTVRIRCAAAGAAAQRLGRRHVGGTSLDFGGFGAAPRRQTREGSARRSSSTKPRTTPAAARPTRWVGDAKASAAVL
jgi:hypothetical protein